jgi:hypothetical protein
MTKLTNEEMKNFNGGFGWWCEVCGASNSGITENVALLQAIAHSGLGHVVHVYVTQEFYNKHKSSFNSNVLYN